jgi:DNA-binding MarR family transcriptional regulator
VSKNKSTERSIFFLLEKTSKIIRERIGEYLSQHNSKVTTIQWLCLHCVHENPGIKQKKLAQKLSKEEASISRIIQKLVKQNFIYRKRSVIDNKTQNLYPSPEGVEIIKKHQDAVLKIYKKTFAGIYDREMNVVNDILKRINL